MSAKSEAAMNELRLDIAGKLTGIEDLCHNGYGLKALSRFTLVARDPANPKMIVVITNEPGRELQTAFEVALDTQDGQPNTLRYAARENFLRGLCRAVEEMSEEELQDIQAKYMGDLSSHAEIDDFFTDLLYEVARRVDP